MKKTLILLALPALSYAQPGCEGVGAVMESTLFDRLSDELKIDTSTIQQDRTKVQLIDVTPVSKVYAAYLAKKDHDEAIAKNRATIAESEYFSSYYGNEDKSITAKYTYFNRENKKDVFIATSFMDKDECSIRFNGYITLSREF